MPHLGRESVVVGRRKERREGLLQDKASTPIPRMGSRELPASDSEESSPRGESN